jgi:hypothetical protein
VVSVVPRTAPDEGLSTVLHASRALMGAAVGANELLGITTESHKLAAVVTEFEQKQHGTHKESLLDRFLQCIQPLRPLPFPPQKIWMVLQLR